MRDLQVISKFLPAMGQDSIEKVRALESRLAELPQVPVGTFHLIHAGMYARTIMIPAGIMMTGALVKCATILIVNGDAIFYIGDEAIELSGHNVLPGYANRKQAVFAKGDTHATMIFPSSAKSVKESEEEFTDEVDLLFSRKDDSLNEIIITGE